MSYNFRFSRFLPGIVIDQGNSIDNIGGVSVSPREL